MKKICVPKPDLQIGFSYELQRFRNLYLQDALLATVSTMNIDLIDKELSKFVPNKYLAILAGEGLRGEIAFAVPCILTENPYLLGYYRLLLGISRKAFFTAELGLSQFVRMEDKGSIDNIDPDLIVLLCKELIKSACVLIAKVDIDTISANNLDDLTLLSLGPQLRGSANVARGTKATADVFKVIRDIVKDTNVKVTKNKMVLHNAAGRKVFIEFASDPDIIIREQMPNGDFINRIAIEIKGGTDFSNIHNRLGEAEKSHQKAHALGYAECWTVINVDRINMTLARRESPNTNKFYKLSDLISKTGVEFNDFKNRIVSLTGIK